MIKTPKQEVLDFWPTAKTVPVRSKKNPIAIMADGWYLGVGKTPRQAWRNAYTELYKD